MEQISVSKSLKHFTKYLFLVGKAYAERNKAKEDVDNHLKKMRKSIIRMNLNYTDIDRLRQKIENLTNWERKYAKFFKPGDNEKQELKNHIVALEQELKNEREEKSRIISEHDEKINELSETLENIKNKTRHLFMEKAKKQHRLRVLEQKINKNVDTNNYYSS